MSSSLLRDFEDILNTESQRIVQEMIQMYQKKIIVNKSFSCLIRDLLKKEFSYYATDIELRIYKFLPPEYTADANNKYALMSTMKATEEHLKKYVAYCLKKQSKNHQKAAQKIANVLIAHSHQPSTNKTLFELIAENMDVVLPKHNDSIDSRAILLYLQSEIEQRGYIIDSLCPFRLIKK